MTLPKVQHRILTVHEVQYHALEWNENFNYSSHDIKKLITNVLQENDVLFYQLGNNRIFTTKTGLFHIQMELVNDIELV